MFFKVFQKNKKQKKQKCKNICFFKQLAPHGWYRVDGIACVTADLVSSDGWRRGLPNRPASIGVHRVLGLAWAHIARYGEVCPGGRRHGRNSP